VRCITLRLDGLPDRWEVVLTILSEISRGSAAVLARGESVSSLEPLNVT
jgi:hypothetical protein